MIQPGTLFQRHVAKQVWGKQCSLGGDIIHRQLKELSPPAHLFLIHSFRWASESELRPDQVLVEETIGGWKTGQSGVLNADDGPSKCNYTYRYDSIRLFLSQILLDCCGVDAHSLKVFAQPQLLSLYLISYFPPYFTLTCSRTLLYPHNCHNPIVTQYSVDSLY